MSGGSWLPPDQSADYEAFVTNLPFDMTEDEVTTLFSQVGVVKHVHIRTDKYSGRSRGMGVVTFIEAESAVLASETLSGVLVKGRPLRVNSSYSLRIQRNMAIRNVDIEGTEQAESSKFYVTNDNADNNYIRGGVVGDTETGAGIEIEDGSKMFTNEKEQLVSGMKGSDYISMLKEAKQLAVTNPTLAAEVFKESPAILFAVLHLLSVIDSTILDLPNVRNDNINHDELHKFTGGKIENLIPPDVELKIMDLMKFYSAQRAMSDTCVDKAEHSIINKETTATINHNIEQQLLLLPPTNTTNIQQQPMSHQQLSSSAYTVQGEIIEDEESSSLEDFERGA